MVKKGLLVLALAAFAAGGVFGQDEDEKPKKGLISAGVGGFFGSDFGGGAEASKTVSGTEIKMNTKMPYFGGGGFVFLDATYAELSLGFFGGSGKVKQTIEGIPGMSSSSEADVSIMNFNIGLLGKYPIGISEKLTVFPLLGIEYDVCLSAKTGGSKVDKPGDFSALWFKLGGGVDYDLTEKIYLRFEALYGLRLKNKFEKDTETAYSALFQSSRISDPETKTLLGHGLTAKIAAGFRF